MHICNTIALYNNCKQLLFAFGMLFAIMCADIQSSDISWKKIKNLILEDVTLIDPEERKEFIQQLFDRANNLNILYKKATNNDAKKILAEKIQTILSVYVYTSALDKYLDAQELTNQIDEKIEAIERLREAAKKESPSQKAILAGLKTTEQEYNKLMNEQQKIYSQQALTKLLQNSFKPFSFIPLEKLPISRMAGELQLFIGNEISFAKKNRLSKPELIKLMHYIQISPLISDEYAAQHGRFYLQALDEAFIIINNIAEKRSSYKVKASELLQKTMNVFVADLAVLTQSIPQ